MFAKALPEVSPEAKPESMEDDWIANFFDKCRLISDEEMQSLWARILAEEANASGRFSKRTVDLVGTLDKSDALLFAQLPEIGLRDDVGCRLLVFAHKPRRRISRIQTL
jgi:hypothetical protein